MAKYLFTRKKCIQRYTQIHKGIFSTALILAFLLLPLFTFASTSSNTTSVKKDNLDIIEKVVFSTTDFISFSFKTITQGTSHLLASAVTSVGSKIDGFFYNIADSISSIFSSKKEKTSVTTSVTPTVKKEETKNTTTIVNNINNPTKTEKIYVTNNTTTVDRSIYSRVNELENKISKTPAQSPVVYQNFLSNQVDSIYSSVGKTISNTTDSINTSINSILTNGTFNTPTFTGTSTADRLSLNDLSVNNTITLSTVSPSVTTDKLYQNGGLLYWSGNLIGGATTGVWSSNGTDVWRATGNVGIGTTTPQAKLDVNGNIRLATTTADATAGVLMIGDMKIHTYGNNSGARNQNFFVGSNMWDSGNFTNTGFKNIAIGGALTSLINGTNNIALSDDALYSNTSGDYNIALGSSALFANTTGDFNIALGANALGAITNSRSNVAIGSNARSSATGSYNTALGDNAGQTASGDENVHIGYYSGAAAGNGNVTIGAYADGWSAGANNLTLIGYYADRKSNVSLTNATAIGSYAKVGSSNSFILGGTGAYAVNVGIGTTSPFARLSVEHLAATGTVIGTDALTTFTGNLLDMRVASTSKFTVNYLGNITTGGSLTLSSVGRNMIITSDGSGNLVSSSTPTAAAFIATSTTATSTFAGAISIGDGVTNTDYLKFDSQRPWIFGASGSGGSTGLSLRPTTAGKTFSVSDSSNTVMYSFNTNLSAPIFGATSTAVIGFMGSGGTSLDSGFSRIGSNKMAIGNGTQGDSTGTFIAGSIGIGTSSPTTKLQIKNVGSDIYSQGFSLQRIADTAGLYIYTNGTTNRIESSHLGAEVDMPLNLSARATLGDLILTASGLVGIGTSSPNAKLSVTGTGLTTGKAFEVTDSANSPKFTVLDNGNVGVGTAGPQTLLQLNGIDGAGDSYDEILRLGKGQVSTTGDGSYIGFANGSIVNASIGAVQTNSNKAYLSFRTNNGTGLVENFKIAEDGNATLGTNLAITGKRLYVYGYANTAGVDSNIEIGDGGPNYWRFARTNTNTFRMDLSSTLGIMGGNVGIGSTSPTAKLSVTGTGLTTGKAFEITDSANSPKFTVLDSGNTTINGTATFGANNLLSIGYSSAVNNYANLSVNNGASVLLGMNAYQADGIGIPLIAKTHGVLAGTAIRFFDAGSGNARTNSIEFWTAPEQAVTAGQNFPVADPRMVILGTGNVGIGTTSPQAKLHVTGTSAAFATAAAIELEDFRNIGGSSGVRNWTIGNALGNNYGALDFAVSASTGVNPTINDIKLSVLNNGYFGVGSSTPTAKLSVTGTGITTGKAFEITDSANSPKFTVLDNGNVGVGNTSPIKPLHITQTSSGLDTTPLLLQNKSNTDATSVSLGFSAFNTDAITGSISNVRNVSSGGWDLVFNNWTSSLTEKMRIGADGIVSILNESNRSYPTIGTTRGGLHISPVAGTNGDSSGITFGANGAGANTAQSGIYSQSSSGYGTKLYLATTDNYTIGAQARMMIDQAGNVGIGSTSPTAKLSVTGAGLTTGKAFEITDSSNVSKFTVLDNGNVGIRTASPSGYLTITDSGSGVKNILLKDTGGTDRFWIDNPGTGSNVRFYDNDASIINTAPSGYLALGAYNSEIMRLKNGSVGIGTTTPTANTKLTIVAPFASYGIEHTDGNVRLATYIDGTGGWLGTISNHNLNFFTNDSLTKMTLSTTGFVGIGTTTPSAKLSIKGTGATTGQNLILTDSNNVNKLIVLDNGNMQNTTLGSAGASLITDASGNITVSSDERLKNIQGNFTRGLNDILSISPILYKWKDTTGYDTHNTYAGFSAQNIQFSIPEAVSIDNNGYLTLAERPILATAINAIRELNIKITRLENATTTTSSFLGNITEWVGQKITSTLAIFDRVETKELCIGKTCVTEEQLKDLLSRNNIITTTYIPPVVVSTSTSDTGTASSTSTVSTTTTTTTSTVTTDISTSTPDIVTTTPPPTVVPSDTTPPPPPVEPPVDTSPAPVSAQEPVAPAPTE